MNGLDKAGATPIHWAAHGGHIECMNALLADPKCQVHVQVCTRNNIVFSYHYMYTRVHLSGRTVAYATVVSSARLSLKATLALMRMSF